MPMDFKWTSARKKRLQSAVRSYNAAITRRERELERGHGELAGVLKTFLPARVTVEGVKQRIHNVADFRRIVGYKNDAKHKRYSELSRILKSVDSHALDFTRGEFGETTTNYQIKQLRLNRQAIERTRKAARKAVERKFYDGDDEVDLDGMSEQEYAGFTSNTDLNVPDEGEYDASYDEEIDPAVRARWEYEDSQSKRDSVTLGAMYELYRGQWTNPDNHHMDMPGYNELLDALDWIAHNEPAFLNKLFNMGYDEMTIEWITDSGIGLNPYEMTPYDTRHNRAVSFILSMAREVGYGA